eukprot:365303-Chlamydomonas_euryale.AAC.15
MKCNRISQGTWPWRVQLQLMHGRGRKVTERVAPQRENMCKIAWRTRMLHSPSEFRLSGACDGDGRSESPTLLTSLEANLRRAAEIPAQCTAASYAP